MQLLLHTGAPRFRRNSVPPLPEVMADQVASVCDQLVKAVTVTMDAETSHIYRLEALKVASLQIAS